jgi:metal-responsive CopG/Arc/MetJ family transcriptional regulator
MPYRRDEMPSKVKVTISLDEALVEDLRQAGRRTGKSRSRLMEEALRFWQRSRLEQELKRGYQAMAAEDLRVAEAALPIQGETLK